MGNLTISDKTLNKYFKFLFRLDNNSKMRLIEKLTGSLNSSKKEAKVDIKSLYGAWIDNKSSDEIIEEIRKSRLEKHNIESF